jgi:hypothetical protein
MEPVRLLVQRLAPRSGRSGGVGRCHGAPARDESLSRQVTTDREGQTGKQKSTARASYRQDAKPQRRKGGRRNTGRAWPFSALPVLYVSTIFGASKRKILGRSPHRLRRAGGVALPRPLPSKTERKKERRIFKSARVSLSPVLMI